MSNRDREWLETDGLGGFASGMASGLRTRRYHGLLITASTPPTGRMMLASGVDVSIETPGGRWMLSSQRYAPDVVAGHGEDHVESFKLDPRPTWVFRLPDGTPCRARDLDAQGSATGLPVVAPGHPIGRPAPAPELAWTRLRIRPFLAGCDVHALMHETPAFSFDPEIRGEHFRFRPYAGSPTIVMSAASPCHSFRVIARGASSDALERLDRVVLARGRRNSAAEAA